VTVALAEAVARRAGCAVFAFVGACVLCADCSSHGGIPPQTTLIVGLQSDPLTGAVGTIHLTTSVAGAPTDDETLPLASLPHETRLLAPPGGEAAAVSVRVDGYEEADAGPPFASPKVLVRTSETHFVPGQVVLLRVLLQGECLLGLPGGPPGAPTCTPPQTCIGGVCQNDSVAPADLEAYSAAWAQNAPDVCKPAHAGAPVVQVGTGQSDFLPLTAGETVQAEQGPQGGHHIWIAVRQQNLKQTGSTTSIASVQPGTGLVGPTTRFVFTFDQDEGGFCKLAGLRYQFDIDGTDYHLFLGKPLDVTVTIVDPSGATGTGVAHINVDPQLLCPSGVSGC